jgi:competence protein ComGC
MMKSIFPQVKNRMEPKEGGFTIVEFMIATMVFSMVLLVCSYAIVHVGRMYYKGVITNRTQDAARRAVEDITSAIQFGARSTDPNLFVRSGTPVTSGGITWQVICVGNNSYTYTTDTAQGTGAGMSPYVLWKERISGTNCPISDFNPNNGQQLLGNNMRLPLLSITTPTSGQLWQVQLRVAYGDNAELFEGNGAETNPDDRYRFCRGVTAGGQFCAISSFETKVVKRL